MSTSSTVRRVDDIDLVVSTAKLAAAIILENGGETSRAEETATILCRDSGWEETDILALSTGIIISAKRDDGSCETAVVRIKSRSYNLFRVERANALSRDYAAGKITIEELRDRLCHLRNSILYTKWMIVLAVGLSCTMFTLLFEEVLNAVVLFDMGVTFVCSCFAQYVCMSSRLKGSYLFTLTFLFSIIVGTLAVLATDLTGMGNLDFILIGAITPLLPGLSFTNAIRDTVMGDLVSGTVRIVETLLVAVAIAGGIGSVLAVYVNFFGGVL
jgi:uncharacterized membrane protein YjjP (DUF1212 family)